MIAPTPTAIETIGAGLDAFQVGTVTRHELRKMFQDFDNVLLTLLSMNSQPGHFDYELAATTKFGRPLVVSPFLASTISALFLNDIRDLAFVQFEINALSFIKPIHPGTTVYCRSEIIERSDSHWKIHLEGWRTDDVKFCEFDLLLTL